jgi:hypothetical protein
VVIYSNYDGGALTINVDQNIPDLKIGVVSYEYSRITVVGAYAGNVTAVWWAGYNGSNNHCALPMPWTTSISGAPAGTDSIMLYPPATWSNPNGYGSIICNYSCDANTNQGGCNTPDQIAAFFLGQWGGAMLFHFTQYGCWGNGYNISAGGNCCINPLATAVAGPEQALETFALSTDEQLLVNTAGPCDVVDAQGRVVIGISEGAIPRKVSLGDLRNGCYLVRDRATGRGWQFVLAR